MRAAPPTRSAAAPRGRCSRFRIPSRRGHAQSTVRNELPCCRSASRNSSPASNSANARTARSSARARRSSTPSASRLRGRASRPRGLSRAMALAEGASPAVSTIGSELRDLAAACGADQRRRRARARLSISPLQQGPAHGAGHPGAAAARRIGRCDAVRAGCGLHCGLRGLLRASSRSNDHNGHAPAPGTRHRHHRHDRRRLRPARGR